MGEGLEGRMGWRIGWVGGGTTDTWIGEKDVFGGFGGYNDGEETGGEAAATGHTPHHPPPPLSIHPLSIHPLSIHRDEEETSSKQKTQHPYRSPEHHRLLI